MGGQFGLKPSASSRVMIPNRYPNWFRNDEADLRQGHCPKPKQSHQYMKKFLIFMTHPYDVHPSKVSEGKTFRWPLPSGKNVKQDQIQTILNLQSSTVRLTLVICFISALFSKKVSSLGGLNSLQEWLERPIGWNNFTLLFSLVHLHAALCKSSWTMSRV